MFRRAIIISMAWVIMCGVLAATGFFVQFSSMPPRPVLTIAIPTLFICWFSFSKNFRPALMQMPLEWPVFFQVFRVAVELLLFLAFTEGILPEQMTFTGLNYDLLAGLLALPVGYYCFIKKKWPRSVAVVYNVLGLLLLLNVLIVAILSFPLPIRYFMNEPSTALVGSFPLIYLPSVLVVLALGMHIISLRALWLQRSV